MLTAFGTLYQQGIDINWNGLVEEGQVLTDLPVYPWDHSNSYWYESRLSKAWRSRHFGHHDFLGLRVIQTTDNDPVWRVMLNMEDVPWLADHKVEKNVVFPFAGYVTMAGEAYRQISGIEDGYFIRNVTVIAAMVLDGGKSLEVVTTLHARRRTGANSAEGVFDFTISSYTGSTWIEHCRGLVARPRAFDVPEPIMDPVPRQVALKGWYEAMARLGLIYGPTFRRIENLLVSTKQRLAVAKLSSYFPSPNSHLALHPATIDASFQVGLAASTKGLCRNFLQPMVPTMIEELEVLHGSEEMNCTTLWSTNTDKLSINCTQTNGKPCLRLRGMNFTPLVNDDVVSEEDLCGAARLEWVADFDFQKVCTLIKVPASENYEKQMIEELALLCIVESYTLLKDLEPSMPDLFKYRAWLENTAHEAWLDKHPVLKDTAILVSLSEKERNQKIEKLCTEASSSPLVASFGEAIMRVRNNIKELFTGQMHTLELLLQDNNLGRIYDAVSFDCSDFICTLSDTIPNLRILEIGAGTGGTTELILRGMRRPSRYPQYAKYTFTDISAGFFPKARERFANAPNMEYRVFDISRDPFEQGFEPSSYDLVLAANVVHATPSLSQTLQNLRPLLASRGQLVLTEFCTHFRAPNYIYGNFSGWWLGEADNRKWEPYVNVPRWDRELKAAGFGGATDLILDSAEPWQYCATIVAQKPAVDVNLTNQIYIVCENSEAVFNQSLQDYLKQEGFRPQFVAPRDSLGVQGDVIASLDLETSFFENISEDRFALFQSLCRNLEGRNLLWLMPPAQVSCVKPQASQSLGIIRTVRCELNLSITTLEIDSAALGFANFILRVLQKVRNWEDYGTLAMDREFAVHENTIKVGRYRPFELSYDLMDSLDTLATHVDPLRTTRSLHPPFYKGNQLPKSIPAGSVEIDVHAVGLSPKNGKSALDKTNTNITQEARTFAQANHPSKKIYPLDRGFSGVIRRVGKEVQNVKAGNRVFALHHEDCLSKTVVLNAHLTVRIPDELSFEEAATMPISFCTAFHALVTIGKLSNRQRVLIHDAATSAGQAAVQICKMHGAKIYLTYGNETELAYLAESFDMSADLLFDLRDPSLLTRFLLATQGDGADIVFVPSGGEVFYAVWKCVADFGMLINYGKQDHETSDELHMANLIPNRSYSRVNFSHLVKTKPELAGSALRSCRDLFTQGKIRPFRPIVGLEVTEDSTRMEGLHKEDFGKTFVAVLDNASNTPHNPYTPSINFDPEVTYMITGGFGGLGKAIAVWLTERGARNLLLLSPSAGSKPSHRQLIAELESMDCTVIAVQGLAQNETDICRAIGAAKRPIRGVIHLSMQLRDAFVLDMTYDDWRIAISPKVDGTWNLHRSLGDSLDFFVMTSSLSTVFHQPGQCNYNAANTFMESFCQYRHNLGRPALVLNVCPIEGVGYVAENSDARRKLKSQGHCFLDECALLRFLELAIFNSRPRSTVNSADDRRTAWTNKSHIVMGLRSEIPLDDPSNRATWRRDRRMGSYHNAVDQISWREPSGWDQLKEFLTRVRHQVDLLDEERSKEYLAREIGKKILSFMMRSTEEEIDLSLTLVQIGLDSLMAIELRRWWKQIFEVDISVLEVMNAGTVAGLGDAAARYLRVKLVESC